MDQKSCLEYRDLSKERTLTLKKIRSDGIKMYQEARYVIVLDENGNVIEKINRRITFTCNVLVVLAPVVFKENKISMSVVLEIGFSRATPYKRIESRVINNETDLNTRRPIAKLSHESTISLIENLTRAIQVVTDEDIFHRRNHVHYTKMNKSGELSNGGYVRLSGMFITIPLENEVLVYSFLIKDMRVRTSGHLSEFVRITQQRLKKLKYGYYPKGQLKRFKEVKNVAEILRGAKYPPSFLNIIRRKLGEPNSKYRALFEQIIDEFGIKFRKPNEVDCIFENLQPTWGDREKELLKKFSLSVATHPKREEKKKRVAKKRGHKKFMHAKGCIRVEVFPSKEALDAKNPVGPSGVRVVNLSENFMNGHREERRRSF